MPWVLPDKTWILMASVFVVSFYLVFSFYVYMENAKPGRALKRLREIRKRARRNRDDGEGPGDQPGPRGVAALRKRVLRQAEEKFIRPGLVGNIQAKLRKADLQLHVAEYVLISLGASLILGLGVLAVSKNVFVALASYMVGLYLCEAYLRYRIRLRRKVFELQLPDALNIMAGSLRSGFSFLQSMEVVGQEMPDPIASEFSRVVHETGVNISLEDALTNLLERMESDDLDLMVTAILIQRQVGGNLAEVLQRIGHTIRERSRILGELRTQTAQGRVTGWVISLLPVALLLVIYTINPGYVRPLFTHPLGKMMLIVAFVMEIAGILAIRKIVDLEV